ncbi:hypothetical protein CDL12_15703 [Handroanthus impetiginosus]|uniref:Putative plant transposon protein domain-containing protein n=1 Tax=Handroanthus impetiginosus TaxID=429701 RepID=A0A2G9H2C7_9LAMI|nr:hypothetical protein CDL12_15703 [Handroanthus impetiginosus]
MVRGKNINFSARTINSLFGTPSIDTPGEWTLSRLNEPIHFPRTTLTFAADNWLRFVSARLLPSSHTSEVTRERAVMIYAILTDVPFDIGDQLLQPDSMIRADRRPPRQAGAPVQPRHRQPPPALGLEARVDRLANEVHQL